jgi:large subunit ribosomal protein L13
MKTFSPKPRDIERRWYVVDADGAVLGRLASHVATILRGKHKPIYAPHADTGDHVIVVNAKGVRVSGGKEFEKIYYRHSGYPGGLRRIGYDSLLSSRPSLAVEKAVGGMLPKNRLGRQMLKKLSVYEGAEHPHQAQKPMALGPGEFPRWEGFPKPSPPPEAAKPVAREDADGPRSRAKRATGDASGPSRRKASGKGVTSGTAKAAAKRAPARRTPRRKASTSASQSRTGSEGGKAKPPSRPAGSSSASSRTAAGTKKDDGSAKSEKPKRVTRRTKKES